MCPVTVCWDCDYFVSGLGCFGYSQHHTYMYCIVQHWYGIILYDYGNCFGFMIRFSVCSLISGAVTDNWEQSTASGTNTCGGNLPGTMKHCLLVLEHQLSLYDDSRHLFYSVCSVSPAVLCPILRPETNRSTTTKYRKVRTSLLWLYQLQRFIACKTFRTLIIR